MAERKTDFYIQTSLLDKYIHTNPSNDPIAVRVILQRLKQSADVFRYFFSQDPSPDWADILLEGGIFSNPPSIEFEGNGFRVPQWPASKYISRIASTRPDIVERIILTINTDNSTVHEDLIEALTRVPSNTAVKCIERVKEWLNNKYRTPWWGLIEKTTRLIVIFAENNFIADAFDLLNEVVRPTPNLQQVQSEPRLGGEAHSRFELANMKPDFWYETVPHLENFDHEAVTSCLLDNLLEALQVEVAHITDPALYRWKMNGWRSSIGDSAQDRDEGYKHTLLRAFRESLIRLIKKDSQLGREMILRVINYEVLIVKRVGIYLLAIFASEYRDLVSIFLLDRHLLHGVDFHNEYFNLLKLGFPILSEDEKDRLVSIILEGPDTEVVEKIARRVNAESEKELQDYKIAFVDGWIRDRLSMIKDHLDKSNRSLLDELFQKYGEPQHPEFLSWMSEVGWVREESPLSINQIQEFDPENLIEFIKTWKPDPGARFSLIEISHRGLSKSVSEVFFSQPQKYTSILPRFVELPASYISAIFSQGQERIKEGKTIPWDEMLLLITSVVNVSKEIKTSEESRQSFNARIHSLWFISDVLNNKDLLPVQYLQPIENALIGFVNDFDPDEQRDNPPDGYIGEYDPRSIAINSVRPLALDSIFKIIHINRNKTEDKRLYRIPQGFLKVLNEKLDRTLENSWAVHSIFGRWTGLLVTSSEEWFLSNIDQIYPDDPKLEKYFISAWESYVVCNDPCEKLISILLPKYFHAIENLSKGKTTKSHMDAGKRLPYHLFMDYFWRKYDLITEKDNLLKYYFSVVDAENRGHAIWTLWKLAETIPEDEKVKYWAQIKNIWKWRTNEFILSGFSNEFYQEFKWFTYILLLALPNETIENNSSLIEPMLTFVDRYSVWANLEKYLANQVERYPLQTIKMYRLMHEKVKQPEYGQHSYEENSDKILFTAVKQHESRIDALAVIDIIGRSNLRYRDVYNKYT